MEFAIRAALALAGAVQHIPELTALYKDLAAMFESVASGNVPDEAALNKLIEDIQKFHS